MKSYFELHFIVLIWGFTAILGKLIHVPAPELVFIRTALAAPGLAVVMLLMGQRAAFRVGRADLLRLLATGALISAHWLLFFASARVANVSISLAGLSTASLWVALLEPAFTGKRLRGFEISLALGIVAGLYLIFRFEFSHVLGLTMGVGSALFAALFSLLNARYTKRLPGTTISFYELAGACLSTALFFPVYLLSGLSKTGHLEFNLTPGDWLWITLLAWACTVYPFAASVRLMRRLSTFAMSLTVNLEPVYGIILARLIFGESEKLTDGFYIGTAVIIVCVAAHPVLETRLRRRVAAAEAVIPR
ncbi:MAG: DMT family transporter [Hymenobacteraceae bacterium]|nr:DMT family transporter [Hymenobacteraceae bacterium]